MKNTKQAVISFSRTTIRSGQFGFLLNLFPTKNETPHFMVFPYFDTRRYDHGETTRLLMFIPIPVVKPEVICVSSRFQDVTSYVVGKSSRWKYLVWEGNVARERG